MFGKLFARKTSLSIMAPVRGEAIALSAVNDPTFGEAILGQGAAIRPAEGRIVSPADGTIDMMFETGHAVSMTTADGIELLIHIGIDTVTLKGAHFTAHVHSGDRVKAGQLLIECDLDAIRAAGFDTVIPIIVCNTAAYKAVNGLTGAIAPGEPLIELTK